MSNQVSCPECNGDLEIAEKDVEILGTIIGQFKCEVCKVCGSTYLDEEAMKKVERRFIVEKT
jgi:YgiT-type zinc finger domain-containing protein